MQISLREITRDNWRECIRLRVDVSQMHYVAANVYSLAQSKYETECVPLAVYDGEQMVGFVMYRPEDYGLAKIWFIDRLLIGEQFQRKGYGQAAMTVLIDRLKAITGYAAILISFHPDNEVARKLYARIGFTDTGEVEEGEIVYRMALMG